jgi:hypothetical protein
MKTLNDIYKVKGENMLIAIENYTDAISIEDNQPAIAKAYEELKNACKDYAELKEMVAFSQSYIERLNLEKVQYDAEMVIIMNKEKTQKFFDNVGMYIHERRVQEACHSLGFSCNVERSKKHYKVVSVKIYKDQYLIKELKSLGHAYGFLAG